MEEVNPTTSKPKSYRSLALVFIGFIICFIDRSAMNIALAYVGKTFTLTPAQLGVVGSAFFFSYSLMQIPGGWLVDRFGTKWMTVVSLVAWSFFTIMTGFAWSLTSLIVIRVLFGIGEGSYPSAAMKQVRLAFPKDKRGQASSVAISSNYIGNAIAPFVVAPLIAALSWRGAFHFVGFLGLVYVLVYFLLERPLGQEVTDYETGSRQEKGKFDWRVPRTSRRQHFQAIPCRMILRRRRVTMIAISSNQRSNWMVPMWIPRISRGWVLKLTGTT